MIKNSAFLVDGRTEFYSFNKKFLSEFKSAPNVFMVKCNGVTVLGKAYANKATPIILSCLNSTFRKIICVIDREGRKEDAQPLSNIFKKEIISSVKLSDKTFSDQELNKKIRVCFADRMFENWILADIVGIKKAKTLVKQSAVQENFEGTIGSKKLNGLMTCDYKKTAHADELFNLVRFNIAKKNSLSLDLFLDLIYH